VTPGARRSELAGVADGRLRVRLAAPALEGRANDELVRFLARELGLRRDEVRVVAGGRSRRKLIHLSGVTLPEAGRRLGL
jgi:uncharacterized protein